MTYSAFNAGSAPGNMPITLRSFETCMAGGATCAEMVASMGPALAAATAARMASSPIMRTGAFVIGAELSRRPAAGVKRGAADQTCATKLGSNILSGNVQRGRGRGAAMQCIGCQEGNVGPELVGLQQRGDAWLGRRRLGQRG